VHAAALSLLHVRCCATQHNYKNNPQLQIPDWVDIVKTACFKELPPLDRDWYYIRAAAVARQVYVRQGLGVGQLRVKFGGRNKTRGVKPEHFKKASGGLIRHILKQLESVGFVEKHTGAFSGLDESCRAKLGGFDSERWMRLLPQTRAGICVCARACGLRNCWTDADATRRMRRGRCRGMARGCSAGVSARFLTSPRPVSDPYTQYHALPSTQNNRCQGRPPHHARRPEGHGPHRRPRDGQDADHGLKPTAPLTSCLVLAGSFSPWKDCFLKGRRRLAAGGVRSRALSCPQCCCCCPPPLEKC
jgi:ribosomal protein S19E (S16A)